MEQEQSIRRAKQTPQPENEFTSGQQAAKLDKKPVVMDVYLSEEPHFDVVLGRSFFEKR
jgi:hypothetical protein